MIILRESGKKAEHKIPSAAPSSIEQPANYAFDNVEA
jgi:hypothetical protein